MKQIYWRPQGTPVFGFILVALLAVGGFIAVEHFPLVKKSRWYQEEIVAASLARQAMGVIKDEARRRGMVPDPEVDPGQSGLIGTLVSPVTTDTGDLEAKQTSINPNFAAVVVDLLRQAGVKDGEPVAISMSGSFPALNIAVLGAARALNLKPTIISSVGASQWGANNPEFLWIDMERLLHEVGVFPYRSVAASFGGRHDTGKELSGAGRRAILEGIERNRLPLIAAANRHENINQRMTLYLQDSRPQAYINVGGAVTAVGSHRRWRHFLHSGLLAAKVPPAKRGDFLVYRFLEAGIPVINLDNVRQLARAHGLPLAPEEIPKVGEGGIYETRTYNPWLTGGVLLGILVAIYLFSLTDLGFRLLQVGSPREGSGPPEPMV